MPCPLIAGNWKMHGAAAELAEAAEVAEALRRQPVAARVAICPPTTLLQRMAAMTEGSALMVGGQDCHADAKGAFTGDVAAEMLAEAGARLVIVGHSERRHGHGEDDRIVAAKVEAALRAGLEPIVCVGETLAERQGGQALAVVAAQLRGSLPDSLAAAPFSVAYEPVWAIGTGLTPSLDEVGEMHLAIRALLADRFGAAGEAAPVLYGGSVNPANAAAIRGVAGVDGVLVGGASLRAADFLQIVRAA
ncbi:MAG: triose-phosphate isomerase [Caulobacterales bacterium 68-7]|nr:MAG: triose-phosphate isomerase [Caulobacterales bacterium 68-7]